jgi:uncharacterized protein
MVRVSWDEAKRQSILRERKIDLLRAALVLDGPTLVRDDVRNDYGEARIIATGEIEGEFYTIVFTQRGDTIRVITAWRAGRSARRRYQERFGRRTP